MPRSLSPLAALAAIVLMSGRLAAQIPFDVRTFSPWNGYAIPNGLWLPGDFNGDGRQDLVHAVRNSDYVHVWTSSGSGSFTVGTFRPWRGYAIPNGLWLAGDFNGDGRSDILHAVQNTDYVHVWLSNGNGTFTVGTFSPWPGYGIPNGLWLIGDYNGDGKSDVLHAVQGTNYVHVWTSNGNGTFTVGTFRPWPGYAIPNGLWLPGDFNGDGRTDIVHAVQNTDYVHVWTSNGNGTFTVGTFRPWAGYAIPNGVWLPGDFNGDGRTDIVHAVRNSDYVHVWTSNSNGTFTVGTFRPWAGYAIPNGVWLAADFDNDGASDLVHAVQNTNYVHTWRSLKNGRFAVGTFSPWPGYAIPNGVWLTLDFTGDRKADIVHLVQGTNYVHPWISTAAGPGEMYVSSLEVTQSIQDLAHSVPVLAAKPTEVRAYLNVNSASPVTVRGVLRARRVFPPLTIDIPSVNTVTIDPAQNGLIRWKRQDLTRSLNFELPASVRGAGWKSFTVRRVIDASSNATIACPDCGIVRRTVRFETAAPFRLRVIGLSYAQGSPPVTFQPSALDFNLLGSWLRRAYPIAQLITSNVTVAANAAPPFGCGDANAQVTAIRNQDIAGGTDARMHYYGYVADAGFFMRGCAGVPATANPAAIGSGPTGSTTWGWDTDGSYGDWYGGHELGHTLGRSHVGGVCGESGIDLSYPFPNAQLSGDDSAFVGMETGDAARSILPAALPGTLWHDVMSYCQRQWLSSYTYVAMRDRLTEENALAPGAPAPGAGAGAPIAGAVPATMSAQDQAGHAAAVPPHNLPPQIRRPARSLLQAPVVRLGRPAPPRIVFALKQVPDSAPPALAGFSADSVRPAGRALETPAPAYSAPPVPLVAVPLSPVDPTLSTPPAAAAVTLRQEVGDFVNVVATVNVTRGTAGIRYLSRLGRAVRSQVAASDRAQLVFRSAAGRVLATHNVEISFDTDIPAGADQTGLIDAIVPYLAGIAELQLIIAGQVVDSRRASAGVPAVSRVATPSLANGAQVLREGFLLEWAARDPDGDSLRYTVQVSADSGRTWSTRAIDLAQTQWRVPPEVLALGRTLLFRVIASDGFNVGRRVSAVIRVPR